MGTEEEGTQWGPTKRAHSEDRRRGHTVGTEEEGTQWGLKKLVGYVQVHADNQESEHTYLLVFHECVGECRPSPLSELPPVVLHAHHFTQG